MCQVLLSVNKVSNYEAPGFSELAGLTAEMQFLGSRTVLIPNIERLTTAGGE